jgi:hypothetical protein
MSGPVRAMLAPCSGPSRPLRVAFGDGLPPASLDRLYAAPFKSVAGTQKRLSTEPRNIAWAHPNLQNLMHTTARTDRTSVSAFADHPSVHRPMLSAARGIKDVFARRKFGQGRPQPHDLFGR